MQAPGAVGKERQEGSSWMAEENGRAASGSSADTASRGAAGTGRPGPHELGPATPAVPGKADSKPGAGRRGTGGPVAVVVEHLAGGLQVQLLDRKGSSPDGIPLTVNGAVEAFDIRVLLWRVQMNHLLADAPFPEELLERALMLQAIIRKGLLDSVNRLTNPMPSTRW